MTNISLTATLISKNVLPWYPTSLKLLVCHKIRNCHGHQFVNAYFKLLRENNVSHNRRIIIPGFQRTDKHLKYDRDQLTKMECINLTSTRHSDRFIHIRFQGNESQNNLNPRLLNIFHLKARTLRATQIEHITSKDF